MPVQVTEEGKVVAVGDGPQGDYLPITGGELTGDLEVDGRITAAGRIQSTSQGASDRSEFINKTGDGGIRVSGSGPGSDTGILLSNNYYTSVEDRWSIKLNGTGTGTGFTEDSLLIVGLDGSKTTEFKQDGSITAAGTLDVSTTGLPHSFYRLTGNTAAAAVSIKGGINKDEVITLNGDGSISAAGGACGFTPTGELIFSSRGTRYKLFVSQGVCQAEEYTRQMELREKSEQFIADKRETKPSEPQQPQPEVTPDNDNA